ncbi:MAG TPA: restriction endonuclease subunit S [Planctomycetota bacterium]|nr:restriction endonuclease subunit S [Planctomycetota bacterium]
MTVRELQREGVLLVEDGNHGEYRPRPDEFVKAGVAFIRAANMDSCRVVFETAARINEKARARITKGIGAPGDVLLSHKGTVGKVALVGEDAPPFVCSPQTTLWRTLNQARLDRQYLYAFLRSAGFHAQLATRAGETDMAPYVSLTSQRGLSVTVPPIDVQRAIAHILGTLDDKIELNRRVSETLEAMARALFKSWFVDFDPVRAKAEGRDPGLPQPLADLFPDSFEDSELGEIPRGWEVATIGAMADVIDCLHSRKPERRKSGLPFLQLANIRDDGLIDMQDTYLIEEVDYQKWVSRMEASPGDCVITNVGRVGAVAQMPANQSAALGRNMTGIRCKSTCPFPTFLIECLLSKAMKDEIAQKMDTGTILDALNVRNIPRLRLSRPRNQAVMEWFERKARPLRAQMEIQLASSRTLAALRDTLLPKLITGELRVKDARRIAEIV